MVPCKYIEICKFREKACSYLLCIHYTPIVEDTAGREGKPEESQAYVNPKAGKKGRKRKTYKLSISSNKDIGFAKNILKQRLVKGTLTEAQERAVNSTKGVRVDKLSNIQKQQILTMVNDSGKEK